MLNGHRHRSKSVRETETTNELIGLLNAISVVSKRLAEKLALLRAEEQKRGVVPNA